MFAIDFIRFPLEDAHGTHLPSTMLRLPNTPRVGETVSLMDKINGETFVASYPVSEVVYKQTSVGGSDAYTIVFLGHPFVINGKPAQEYYKEKRNETQTS